MNYMALFSYKFPARHATLLGHASYRYSHTHTRTHAHTHKRARVHTHTSDESDTALQAVEHLKGLASYSPRQCADVMKSVASRNQRCAFLIGPEKECETFYLSRNGVCVCVCVCVCAGG